MFRKSYNRAVLRIRIETVTPLLIRAGNSGLYPAAADLTCVRTRHARWGNTVYIPGSSLKGVVRSAAEASVRGRRFGSSRIEGACENPLDTKGDASCGGQIGKVARKSSNRGTQGSMPTHEVHQRHCLACRAFGSLAMKGRVAPRDLFPWSGAESASPHAPKGENYELANNLELRHSVAIDRLTGSVKHGPFDQELVPAGVSFWGDIALENYQVWQLGLLAEAFRQIDDGIAQLGSSKSRGLGVATVHVERIVHEQSGSNTAQPQGVGDLASEKEFQDYGLLLEGKLPPTQGQVRGLATRFEVTENARTWLEAGLAGLGGLRQ